MDKISKIIFKSGILFLIIISLYPGSIFGLLFYGDIEKQPSLIPGSIGTSINHFVFYFFISMFGLIIYLRSEKFKKILYFLLLLAVLLECLQLIIPIREFETYDLFGNILGVVLAYFIVKIYLTLTKHD